MTEDMKEFLERLAFLLDRFNVTIEGETTSIEYDATVKFTLGPTADKDTFEVENEVYAEKLFDELRMSYISKKD